MWGWNVVCVEREKKYVFNECGRVVMKVIKSLTDVNTESGSTAKTVSQFDILSFFANPELFTLSDIIVSTDLAVCWISVPFPPRADGRSVPNHFRWHHGKANCSLLGACVCSRCNKALEPLQSCVLITTARNKQISWCNWKRSLGLLVSIN